MKGLNSQTLLFRYFQYFFYFVYVFSLFRPIIFQKYIFLTTLNFKNSFKRYNGSPSKYLLHRLYLLLCCTVANI
jgi:hypothetical protein